MANLGAFRNSSAHNIWRTMIARCHNPKSKDYPGYGGRGITVCLSWRLSFWNFLRDMGEPRPGQTLDRRENSRGYGPDNCQWATRLEQAANTRRNRLIRIGGQERHLAAWCRHFGVKITTAKYRMDKLGWPPERALRPPVHNFGLK